MKTKFAVHWAPSVYACTPGWMVAVSAGAHAALTRWVLAAAAGWAVMSAAASTALTRIESAVARRRVPVEVKLMEMVPPW